MVSDLPMSLSACVCYKWARSCCVEPVVRASVQLPWLILFHLIHEKQALRDFLDSLVHHWWCKICVFSIWVDSDEKMRFEGLFWEILTLESLSVYSHVGRVASQVWAAHCDSCIRSSEDNHSPLCTHQHMKMRYNWCRGWSHGNRSKEYSSHSVIHHSLKLHLENHHLPCSGLFC